MTELDELKAKVAEFEKTVADFNAKLDRVTGEQSVSLEPEEGTAEGSLEWAQQQDCKVTHEGWDPVAWVNLVQDVWSDDVCFGGTGDGRNAWENFDEGKRECYSFGWKLWERPAGWYSVLFTKGNMPEPAHWNTCFWVCRGDQRQDEAFHWISNKRIVLDTPEGE